MTATNPWLTRPPGADDDQVPAVTAPPVAPLTGPSGPQSGVPLPDPEYCLPVAAYSPRGVRLWVVGAHGGSGESTLELLDDSWRAAGHVWPAAGHGQQAVLLAARTSERGLMRARGALAQWGAGAVPHVDLLGLVLIADAPGRLPKPLKDLSRLVAGGAPRCWSVPWVEAWRMGDAPGEGGLPRQVRRLVRDVSSLVVA